MKIKVAEASGVVLDYIVAIAEGALAPMYGEPEPRVVRYVGREQTYMRINPKPDVYYSDRYCPSIDWAYGGPIIERERITFDYLDYSSGPEDVVRASLCRARLKPDRSASWYASKGGSTLLIAAMRCYAASKLGEEVEVPDDLAHSTETC